MIIERSLLKLALGGTAIAAAALVIRKLLKEPAVKVVRREVAPRPAAANEDVEVPWGVEV